MNINIYFDLDKNKYADFINCAFDTSDAVGFIFKKYKQHFNENDGSRMPIEMYEDTDGISQDRYEAQKTAMTFDRQYAKFRETVAADLLRTKNIAEWPTIGRFVIYEGRPKGDFEIMICRCSDDLRKTVLSAGSFACWKYPYYPEDVCFFRNRCCWFLSYNCEKRAVLTVTDANDIIRLDGIGVIDNSKDERYIERY